MGKVVEFRKLNKKPARNNSKMKTDYGNETYKYGKNKNWVNVNCGII